MFKLMNTVSKIVEYQVNINNYEVNPFDSMNNNFNELLDVFNTLSNKYIPGVDYINSVNSCVQLNTDMKIFRPSLSCSGKSISNPDELYKHILDVTNKVSRIGFQNRIELKEHFKTIGDLIGLKGPNIIDISNAAYITTDINTLNVSNDSVLSITFKPVDNNIVYIPREIYNYFIPGGKWNVGGNKKISLSKYVLQGINYDMLKIGFDGQFIDIDNVMEVKDGK